MAVAKKRTKPKPLRKETLIGLRVSPEHKKVLAEAAEAAGLSLSSFLVNAGLEKAKAAKG